MGVQAGMHSLMLFCYIFAVAVETSTGASSHLRNARPPVEKIAGGAGISISDAPYLLQLQIDDYPVCGASIIGRFFALTSAGCVYGLNQRQMTLRTGSDRFQSGGYIHQVYKVNVHPQYDEHYHDYDVAVLEVATPFRFDTNTQSISLGTTEPRSGSMVWAAGWGRTTEEGSTSNQLQGVDIPVIPRTNCTTIYAGDVTLRMFCAGLQGQGACQGDTGGPLVQNSDQVGVTSWSYGCARDGYPGVYSNIANIEMRTFITDILNGF